MIPFIWDSEKTQQQNVSVVSKSWGKERILLQSGAFSMVEWFSILSMEVIHMTCFC